MEPTDIIIMPRHKHVETIGQCKKGEGTVFQMFLGRNSGGIA